MKNVSYYTERLRDDSGVYLEQGAFGIAGDGITDDTKAIQAAVKYLWERDTYGVVFLPEGEYLVSDTIYMPKAIRLVGYGKKRPLIRLKDHCKGFQEAHPDDRYGYRYLFWFTDNVPEEGEEPREANPGTFYSGISNVDIDMGQGNEMGCAIRSHYAQHCFVAHMDIHMGDGFSAFCACGNMMEDIAIYGGNYGIYAGKCSPGWPFVMMDIYMEGQKCAAVCSFELGLNAVRIQVKDTQVFLKVLDNCMEKLVLEDSYLENIGEKILDVPEEEGSLTQLHIRNTYCRHVPTVAEYRQRGTVIHAVEGNYLIQQYTHGFTVEYVGGEKQRTEELLLHRQEDETAFEAAADAVLKTDIPPLPPMAQWHNLLEFGAAGDGVTDDTEAIRQALKQGQYLFVPSGSYRISDTIYIGRDQMLLGLHPMSSRILLTDNTENFTGFGTEKPMISIEPGSNAILSGIGLDAGGRNPRASALLWQGGADSYLNDVKFIGGHGTMEKGKQGWITPYNRDRTGDAVFERIWDFQYPSLHVTGGGVFVNLWSASPYASAGLLAENTDVPCKIYCISIEHHCRREAFLRNVSNWRIYGFQTEEEKAESVYALPLELTDCENVRIASIYLFRTVYVTTPAKYAIKTGGCRNVELLNIHNYAQMRYVFDNVCFDQNTGEETRCWELARLSLDDAERAGQMEKLDTAPLETPVQLFEGFRTADGGCCNSRGDFFFLDSADKKIYKIDGKTARLSLICETPFKPNALLMDTLDHLLAVGEYSIPIGAAKDGVLLENHLPEDSYGSSYGYWYDRRAYTVVYRIREDGLLGAFDEIPAVSKETAGQISRVAYPGNRWRDSNDYLEIVHYPWQNCYVAPDGVTVIPALYDLMRSHSIAVANVGEMLCSTDEYHKRTYGYVVDSEGMLTKDRLIAEEGEYGCCVDGKNVYVADGHLSVYSREGQLKQIIRMPVRPSTMAVGGTEKNLLFVTAKDRVYAIKLRK